MKYSIFLLLATINAIKGDLFANSRNKTLIENSYQIPWFLKVAPFFDLTKIDGISSVCKRDFHSFLSAMDRLELWALKSE